MTKKIMTTAALATHMAAMPYNVMAAPMADAGNVAAQLVEVSKAVAELREQVMPNAENALKEAKAAGDVSKALKAEIDKVLPLFNEANALQAKLEGKLEALESRSTDLEQLVAEGAIGRGGSTVSAGLEFAGSDELKAFVAAGADNSFKMDVNAAITTADGSGGGVIWSDRETKPVNMPERKLIMRSLINVIKTNRGSIEYTRQSLRTNAAAPVAEGAAAPASAYGWTKENERIKKISHVTHVSEEALADSDELAGLIDHELRYGLDLEEDEQILAGDGVGENLDGLLNSATAFVAPAGLPNTDRLDRLRLAILQVTLNDYAADAIVLNPFDMTAIDLMRDAQSRFIMGGADQQGITSLWRLPVAESTTMSANSWLVGAMKAAATLYDRQQNEILISSEHGTNFVDGMKTLKGTTRKALITKRPASLVAGDFTFI